MRSQSSLQIPHAASVSMITGITWCICSSNFPSSAPSRLPVSFRQRSATYRSRILQRMQSQCAKRWTFQKPEDDDLTKTMHAHEYIVGSWALERGNLVGSQ